MEWSLGVLVILSGLVRLLLICWGRIQDYALDLPFTDVDYRVFTAAARALADGGSPFDAPTYRYTPLLAYALQPNLVFPDFGKLLFNAGDLAAAWLIHAIVVRLLGPSREREARLAAGIWLFNPLTPIISSRGNAESLVSLAVLATLHLLLSGRWIVAALLHGGLAIPLKLYPVIYLPSVFVALLQPRKAGLSRRQPLLFLKGLLLNWRGYAYVVISLASFGLVSAFSYLRFGQPFLDQSLLYHLHRIDFRHNFSPYFYLLYLAGDSGIWWSSYLGVFAFLPQLLLPLLFALRFGDSHLPLAWFLSTLAFVSFNKVCTSQYFVWYLCLMPVVWWEVGPSLSVASVCRLSVAWLGAQGLWLGLAYLLEFQGLPTFLPLCLASLAFLGVNSWILAAFLSLRAQKEALQSSPSPRRSIRAKRPVNS